MTLSDVCQALFWLKLKFVQNNKEKHNVSKGPFKYYVRVFWVFIEPPTYLQKSCGHVVRDFESEAKTRGNF